MLPETHWFARLLINLPPTIAAIAAFIVAVRNGRKTQEIHLMLNSRLDAMIEQSRKAAFAAGVAHEKERFKKERK